MNVGLPSESVEWRLKLLREKPVRLLRLLESFIISTLTSEIEMERFSIILCTRREPKLSEA